MSAQRVPSHSAASRRVLVVDDQRDFADGLGECLIDAGYDVSAAYSVSRLPSVSKWFDVQAEILDFGLGTNCSLDLARQLRERRLDLLTARADEVFAALDRCFDKLGLEEIGGG